TSSVIGSRRARSADTTQSRIIKAPATAKTIPLAVDRPRRSLRSQLWKRNQNRSQSAAFKSTPLHGDHRRRLPRRLRQAQNQILERFLLAGLAQVATQLGELTVQQLMAPVEDQQARAQVLDKGQQVGTQDEGRPVASQAPHAVLHRADASRVEARQ